VSGDDREAELVERVASAAAARTPLRVVGGDTRRDWIPAGAPCRDAEVLSVAGHRGVVQHAASELVLTARAGTPLEEVEAVLAESGQCLPFEPPRFGAAATLGGAVSAGLSGPARPWRGALRDAVLGVRLLDGHGTVSRFGGEVMKNVAGYDVSRLVAGAQGVLGVVLEVSLRVAARPETEAVRVLDEGLPAALERMRAIGRRPLPVTGLAWCDGRLHVRLAGSEGGVAAAAEGLGGDPSPEPAFFDGLRDLALPFFAGDGELWRLSLPVDAPQPSLPANWLVDWGGHQRWCLTDAAPERVLDAARRLGGHATRLRPDVLRTPLADGVRTVHRRLLAALDPAGILNPGALYPDLVAL
jgi:glycolate oxidase FAD binding subunit